MIAREPDRVGEGEKERGREIERERERESTTVRRTCLMRRRDLEIYIERERVERERVPPIPLSPSAASLLPLVLLIRSVKKVLAWRSAGGVEEEIGQKRDSTALNQGR